MMSGPDGTVKRLMDNLEQSLAAAKAKSPHPYTVDVVLHGAEHVPCTICGGGRNERLHRCVDPDCDGNYGHEGKHYAWMADDGAD